MNGTSLGARGARWLAVVALCLSALGSTARAADPIEAGYCDPASGSLPTIQQALDTAQPGDTIEVCPGVYNEHVTIAQRDVKVVSRDGPAETIIAPASYYGFVVRAPNVRIGDAAHGFTITSAELAIDLTADDPGVEADGAHIEGNKILGFGDVGISIDMGADDVEVVGNTVTQNIFTSLVSQAGIAVNADGNPNHQAPTHRAQILDNTIVASPGLGLASDGLPSGSSLTTGIAVWQAGGSHVIAGNTVRGTWVGISFGEGVRDAEVHHNDVGPAGGDAAATAPDRYVGLSDPNDGGVLALGLRNLWHDNTCSPAYQTSAPAGLCSLQGAPPTPAALKPGEIVEGIPTILTVQGAGPGLAKSRIKLGGDARDPEGYDGFDQPHQIEVASVPASGIQTIHVQGRNDGAGERPISKPVTFDLPVRRNEVPAATADGALELTEDGPARGIVLGARNEPEEDVTLQVVDAEDLTLGRLEGTDANGRVVDPARGVTYVPAQNANGTETFHFVACDGFARDGNPRGCSAPQTLTVTIAQVDDRPVAQDAALTVAEDGSAPLTLSGSDVETTDPDDLAYELVGAVGGEAHAANGTVRLEGRQATYTPNANYHGPDAFRYRVTDAEGETAEGEVAVAVSAVNDAPAIEPGSLSVDSGERGSVPLRATDVDGDPIAFSVSDPANHGRAEVTGENAVYAPDPGFAGEDGFSVRASDPTGAFAEAPITVSVRAAPAVQPRSEAPASQVSALPPVSFGGPADPPGARVRSVRGRVAVTPPGGARGRLTLASVVPAGSLVDATAGTVVLGVAPGETLRVARGQFTVTLRTERRRQVIELVLRGAAQLDVLARCRCRVVTAEARVEAFQPARWLMARRATGTSVRVLDGRVRVTGKRARSRWVAAGRALTVHR